MRVADIACGTGHSLVVTEDSDVIAWGWNSKGQCGLDTSGAVSEACCVPTMLGSLLGLRVRGVACGAAHSLAVTANGEVLSWGLGGSGQLGHGDYFSTPTPRRIMGLASEVALGCACGFGHSIVLSKAGSLYSWGWNRDGQLGVGDLENRASPQKLAVGAVTMSHVACGGGHSAVVSTSGELYCFGSASCGQLGLGRADENGVEYDRVTRPSLVQALKEKKVKVAYASCGEEFTLAISDTQSVYVFGLGNVGQMGNGIEGNAELPVLVDGMQSKQAEVASCGAAQAHVVSTSGQVFVWGLAGTDTQVMVEELRRASMTAEDLLNGNISKGQDLTSTVPDEVAALKGKKVVRLDAGRRHFACLVCPASPLHSRLLVPDEWSESHVGLLPAGKRCKLKLQVYDTAGRKATAGGERVVARLLWDGGDEYLVGTDPGTSSQEDIAAAMHAAAVRGDGAAPFAPSTEERQEADERAKGAIAAALLVDVDDSMDGTYEISMRPRREGEYSLCVWLNGELVLGSPQQLRVLASKPYAHQCELLPVRVLPKCAEHGIAHLVLRDEFGNDLAYPPEAQDRNLNLQLSITKADGPEDALSGAMARLERFNDTMEDEGSTREAERRKASRPPPSAQYVLRDDGVVVIKVYSEISGKFALTAILDGVNVKGSGIKFDFSPGAAYAPCCWAHSDAIRKIVAGRACGLVVRCFDEFGNDVCDDMNDLVGRLSRDGPATALQARLPPVRARPPEPPGSSVLMFTPTKAAEYLLEATMNGRPLPGSPFPITVQPGKAEAITSMLHGEGLEGAVVRRGGLKRTLELTSHDVHGNPCVEGGAEVSVSLRMIDGAPLSRPASARPNGGSEGGGSSSRPASARGRLKGTVVDRGDGTYALEYTALPGEWLMEVSLNGRNVQPTPCSIVNAADPSEEEERRAREAMERERQQKEAEEAEAARRAAEAEEAARVADELRRRIEEELIAQAKREDEKLRKAAEKEDKQARKEDEKRKKIMAALRREEETRRRRRRRSRRCRERRSGRRRRR